MTKGDKYLIFFVVIISLISLVYVNKGLINVSSEKYVSIKVDGKKYRNVVFDSNTIGTKISISTKYGYNLVEIGDGRVRVIEADCPDKLDVKQGWISKPGEMIVCLPHKLVIEIVGGKSEDDVDYISY